MRGALNRRYENFHIHNGIWKTGGGFQPCTVLDPRLWSLRRRHRTPGRTLPSCSSWWRWRRSHVRTGS